MKERMTEARQYREKDRRLKKGRRQRGKKTWSENTKE